MTLVEGIYVAAGVALPAYYLPQIARCASDRTQLASYSMCKSAMQLLLRSAMLPFVVGIGNPTMTWIVSLDFAGRAAEFGMAVLSLRRQGLGAAAVLRRCLPLGGRAGSARVGARTDLATMIDPCGRNDES